MRTLSVSLLTAAALALTGLAAPAISSAATCPAGQSGTPPYCKTEPPKPEPPTPSFVVVSIGNEVSGKVKVSFNAPGPGKLRLKGKAISLQGLRITVTKSGEVLVRLKATGKVLQHLNNKGWTRRKQVYATFTGTDGTVTTVKVVIRFRKPHHG